MVVMLMVGVVMVGGLGRWEGVGVVVMVVVVQGGGKSFRLEEQPCVSANWKLSNRRW